MAETEETLMTEDPPHTHIPMDTARVTHHSLVALAAVLNTFLFFPLNWSRGVSISWF